MQYFHRYVLWNFAVNLFPIRWKIFFYSLEIKNARKAHYFFIVNFIIFKTDDIKIVNSVNFVNRQFRVVFTKN